MMSVKQGGIKYNFWSFWYDLTWDWTLVSWTTGENSNHYTKTFNIIGIVFGKQLSNQTILEEDGSDLFNSTSTVIDYLMSKPSL